jgi:hypothetical protein
MRISAFLLSLCLSAVVAQDTHEGIAHTVVFIESIDAQPSIAPFAEIDYNPSTLEAEITSYNAPILSPESKLVRLGIYDEASHSWESSTTATSAENFSKGYAPIITLTLDSNGSVLGASCRSVMIDAGQTRDFGPKIRVVQMAKARVPELNRPIVLSKEGKLEAEVPEKTFIQK